MTLEEAMVIFETTRLVFGNIQHIVAKNRIRQVRSGYSDFEMLRLWKKNFKVKY